MSTATIPESTTYIAKCPTCGNMVMGIVDSPDRRREVAKEVAKHLRLGYAIERVTTAWVRESAKFCDCASGNAENAEQSQLFLVDQ